MLTADASMNTGGGVLPPPGSGLLLQCGIVRDNNAPFYVVDFVCKLAFLAIFFIGLVLQHLNPVPTSSLILTGFGHREQLSHLILSRTNRLLWSLNGPQLGCIIQI